MNKNHLLSLVSILLFASSTLPQQTDLIVLKNSPLFRPHKKGNLQFRKLRVDDVYSTEEMDIDIEEV